MPRGTLNVCSRGSCRPPPRHDRGLRPPSLLARRGAAATAPLFTSSPRGSGSGACWCSELVMPPIPCQVVVGTDATGVGCGRTHGLRSRCSLIPGSRPLRFTTPRGCQASIGSVASEAKLSWHPYMLMKRSQEKQGRPTVAEGERPPPRRDEDSHRQEGPRLSYLWRPVWTCLDHSIEVCICRAARTAYQGISHTAVCV